MRHTTASMLCICALLAACSSQSQEKIQPQTGIISGGEYQYAPLDWRISLPWRWTVQSTQHLQEIIGKGRSLLEKATDGNFVDTETQLLHLRYDSSNQFTSSVSPFDASAGSEPEQVTATFDMILAAYEVGKIPVQSTRDSEYIGGVRFDLLRISMLDRKGKREVVQQNAYLGHIGSSWLMVSIVTTNWIPRQQMLRAWRGSHFSTARDTDQVDSGGKPR